MADVPPKPLLLPAENFPLTTNTWPATHDPAPNDPATEHDPAFGHAPALQRDRLFYFLPALLFTSPASIRSFVRIKNPHEDDEFLSDADKTYLAYRLIYEYVNKGIQEPVGSKITARNPKYKGDKQGFNAPSEDDAPGAPATPASEAAGTDGDADEKGDGNDQGRKRRRRGPPAEPETIEVTTSRFFDAVTNTERDKVDVYIQVLVRATAWTSETGVVTPFDALQLYSVGNIVGYAFIYDAVDPNFRFSTAFESLAMTLQARWTKYYGDNPEGLRSTKYHATVRRIKYGLACDYDLTGYENVVSALGYDKSVANAYATLIGTTWDGAPFSTSMFSLEAFRGVCKEAGVCEEQLLTGPDVSGRLFTLATPNCTAKISMAQADPDVFGKTTWPWDYRMTRDILPTPLADHQFSPTECTQRDASFHALESYGMRPAPDLNNLVEEGPKRPYERSHARYEKVRVQLQQRWQTCIKLALAMEAKLNAAALRLTPGTVWTVATEPASGSKSTAAFDVLMHKLKQAIGQSWPTPVVTSAEYQALETDANAVELNLRRLQRTMHEDYMRFMRPGNLDMPSVGQAILFWGEHRNSNVSVACATFSVKLSPFANMLLTLTTLLSAGHRIAGSMHNLMQAIFGIMDHCSGPKAGSNIKLYSNIYIHGKPGTDKSGTFGYVGASLIKGTIDGNTAGGSALAQIFDVSAEMKILSYDEVPPNMQRSRKNMDSSGQASAGVVLSSLTSPKLSYPQTRQRKNPSTGDTSYSIVTVKNKTAANRLVAGNFPMEDAAMASRFNSLLSRQPRGKHNTPIHKKTLVNQTQADLARDAATVLVSTLQWGNFFARIAEWTGLIPPPSHVLFDLQMRRFTDFLKEIGFVEAGSQRRKDVLEAMYDSLITVYACYVHLLSEAAPGRNPQIKDDKVVFEDVTFGPQDVVRLIPYRRDNEEIVNYCIMLRFNELVDPFDFLTYDLLFTDMLSGAHIHADALAAWVRYTAYMDLVTSKKTTDDVDLERDLPYFRQKMIGRGNDRATYAFGSILEEPEESPQEAKKTTIRDGEPFLIRAPLSEMVAKAPNASGHLAGRARGSLASLGQNRFGMSRFGTKRHVPGGGGRPQSTQQQPRPSFLYDTKTYYVDQVHPKLRSFIFAKPEPMFHGGGITLWRGPKGNLDFLDPNYALLEHGTMTALAQHLSSTMSENKELGWAGDATTVSIALEALKKTKYLCHQLRTHRLDPSNKNGERAATPLLPAGQPVTEECFARCFLMENIEDEASDMDAIKTRDIGGADSKYPKMEIYILLPLLKRTYDRLRERALSLFSHKDTRDRLVTPGANPWSDSADIEFYHLKPSKSIISLDAQETSNIVENKRLPKALACKHDAVAPIMPSGSRLQEVERTQTISIDKLVIDGDIEQVCSRQYALENNLDDTSLPAAIMSNIKKFYEQYPQSVPSKEAASFDAEAEAEDAVRNQMEGDLMTYDGPDGDDADMLCDRGADKENEDDADSPASSSAPPSSPGSSFL